MDRSPGTMGISPTNTWVIMVDILVDIADVCLPSWCITNISLGAMVDITRVDGVYKPPCGIYIYKVYNN
jgi:hypothetical protein